MVLRYGMAQRHMTEYDVIDRAEASSASAGGAVEGSAAVSSDYEGDNVRAMVAGVKEQGVSGFFFLYDA